LSSVIIIGNGPAGISAALYTTRAGIETIIIGKDHGALGKASEIENYYGFSQPISGKDLIQDGIKGAKRLGAKVISDEVVGISYFDKFVITTKENDYYADSVVIATGTSRSTPKIKGLKEFEGHGVSYCAVCDAFFYRGKDVAVLGDGEYALHEALELLPTSNSVTLLTNGKQPSTTIPDNIKVNTKIIDSLNGNNVIDSVVFHDGSSLAISGLFVAIGVAGSTDLAKKLGASTENNKILTDGNMATNVPGLFAAGDCTGGLLQISKAVYEGARAGTEVIQYLRIKNSRKSA
jgi:thioredoxin reductase (NADPH)